MERYDCPHMEHNNITVMLNGEPGTPIKHARGLRQGDPYPLCFLL